MATNTNYKEVQALCVDFLGKHYDVSPGTLSSLSCHQISKISEIFSGNLVGQPVTSQELSVPQITADRLPVEPPKSSETEVCKPKDYKDLLYVPSMPHSGKQAWFLLSEVGATHIKKEIAHMDALQTKMVGIYDATRPVGQPGGASKSKKDIVLQEMGRYGLLSKFMHLPHEHFLIKDDDLNRYRALLLFKQAVIAKPEIVTGHLIAKDAADGIAKEFQGDFKNAIERSKFWHNCIGIVTSNFSELQKLYETIKADKYTKVETQKFRASAIDDLMETLNSEIEKIEELAELEAGKRKTDDGTAYLYSKDKGYFTSVNEEVVYKNLSKVNSTRASFGLEEDEITHSSLDDLKEKLVEWQNKADIIANLTDFHVPNFQDKTLLELIDREKQLKLYNLNSRGIAIIEQCLSDDDLAGKGDQKVDHDYGKVSGWMGKDLLSDDDVATLLKNVGARPGDVYDATKHKIEWSYYPARAMKKRVDLTLSDKTKTTKSLLQVHGLPGQLFQPLITLKKIIEARIEVLHEKARKNAKSNTVTRMYVKDKTSFELIINEDKWAPAEKTKELFTDTGKADFQVVECYLASKNGEMSFVRGPSWMIPDGDVYKTDHCGHLCEITDKLSDPKALEKVGTFETAPESTAQILNNMIKAISANGATNLGTIDIAQQSISKMDSALSKGVYRWYPDGAKLNQRSYSAAAQYQFMRFTSSSSIGAKADLLEAEKEGKITVGEYGVDAKLNVLQGSLSLNAQLPTVSGQTFIIPYVVRVPKPLIIKQAAIGVANKDEILRSYDAGRIRFDLSTTLYGMLGASLTLGAKAEFGMLEDGGVGVKGTSSALDGMNQWQANTPYIKGVGESLKSKAADLTVTASAFAGVEVGGKLDAKLLWEPPKAQSFSATEPLVNVAGNSNVAQKGSFRPLAKFSVEASAAFGASGTAVMKFSLSGGRLVVLLAAKVALGPGVGGKFAFEIHHSTVNDFFDLILKIMNEEGFRRITIFDEGKVAGTNQTTFELFNTLLTAQLMTGLQMADLLLLPLEALGKYTDASSRRELAPSLAKFITNDLYLEQSRKWITNMPPETIALMFEMLVQAQIYNPIEWLSDVLTSGAANEKAYNKANTEQAHSVIKVMEYISTNTYIPFKDTNVSNLPARVFSKAITRMGFKYYEVPTKKEEQWAAFLSNWLSLYRITKKSLGVDEFRFFVLSSRKLCTGYEVALIRHKQSSQVKMKCCYIGDCQSKKEMEDRRELAGYNDKEFKVFKTGSVCDIFN